MGSVVVDPSSVVEGRPVHPTIERQRPPGHREPRREELRRVRDRERGPHLVLLARDLTGYRSLCRLTSAAHLAGTKGVPRFTQALLAEHTEGLVALSGCRHGEIARRLLAGDRSGAEAVALAVSPDNRHLAMSYVDFASATIRVATLGIDGQGFTEIVRAPRPATLAKQLSWSQDGEWIYFSTRPGDNSTSRHRIVKVSRNGGPVQDLGLEVDGLTGFAISSDGSHLAYSSASSEPASSVVLALELNAPMSGRR